MYARKFICKDMRLKISNKREDVTYQIWYVFWTCVIFYLVKFNKLINFALA